MKISLGMFLLAGALAFGQGPDYNSISHRPFISATGSPYFAKGDGVKDDTAAIQSLFSAKPVASSSFAGVQGAAKYLVSATVTMTVPVGVLFNSPGPTIDLGGATILCKQTSGPCLKFISANIAARQGINIINGTIQYAGSSPNVTGVLIQDFIQPGMDSVKIMNFNTSGSVGLTLTNTEIGHFTKMYFADNTLALHVTNLSTTNRFTVADFETNKQAILIDQGSTTFTCDQCVVEANTGVHAVEVKNMVGDPDGITGTRFINSYFEGNGDGTSSSRALYFYADTGRFLLTTKLSSNNFNTPNPSGAVPIEFAGPGTISYVDFDSTQCNLGGGNLTVGAASFVSSRDDNCAIPFYDTAQNTGGVSGTTYWAAGAANRYNLANISNQLVVTDVTSGAHIAAWTTGGFFSKTHVPIDASSDLGDSVTYWRAAYITTIHALNIALSAGGVITTPPTAVGLGTPCTAGIVGSRSYVTDANTTLTLGIGTIVVGGGANKVPINCDGTNWRIG